MNRNTRNNTIVATIPITDKKLNKKLKRAHAENTLREHCKAWHPNTWEKDYNEAKNHIKKLQPKERKNVYDNLTADWKVWQNICAMAIVNYKVHGDNNALEAYERFTRESSLEGIREYVRPKVVEHWTPASENAPDQKTMDAFLDQLGKAVAKKSNDRNGESSDEASNVFKSLVEFLVDKHGKTESDRMMLTLVSTYNETSLYELISTRDINHAVTKLEITHALKMQKNAANINKKPNLITSAETPKHDNSTSSTSIDTAQSSYDAQKKAIPENTVSRDPTWIADNLKTPGDLWKLGNMKYIDTQDGCIRLACKESAYEDIEIKIPQKQMEAFGGTSFINDLGNVKSQKIPFHLSPQEPNDEKDLMPRFTVKQGEWVLPTLSPSMQAVHDRFQGFANGTYDLYIANSGKNTQAKYIPADENFNKNNKQYPVYAFDAAKMSDLGLKALEVQKRQGGGFLYPSAATRAHCEVKLVTSQENNAVRLGFSVNGERRPLQTSINLEPQQDRPLYNALKTLSPINGHPFNPQAGAELSWAKGAYVLTQGTEKWSIDTKHKAYKACDDRANGRQPNRNR